MGKIKVGSVRVNFIYNTVYQISAIIVPLITTPYLARVLGAEQIGVFSYAFSVAYYFGLFAMLGVNNYGNRSIAQSRDDEKLRSRTFYGIYSFQLFSSIIMTLSYVLYVLLWGDDKTIGVLMIIYVISCGLDINWFFFGIEQFKLTTIRNVFIKLFSVVGIFVFVKKPSDVYMYGLIYVLSQLISQLILWITIKKYIIPCRIQIKDITCHIKPNLVLFIPVLAISLYKIMDKIMLGAMISKIEVGYYESCERIIQVPIALINSLGTVMLPRISNLIANNEREEGNRYLKKSLLFAMLLASSMGFGIMGVAREFVPLFYGEGFEKCVGIFQVLLPSCLFLAFANVIRTQYLIPNKMDKAYSVSIISGAVINLLINALLIPVLGAVGAGIGTLCAEASVCIVQCVFVRKELPIKKYFVDVLPFLFVGFLMYAIIFNISLKINSIFSVLCLKIIVGGAIYLFLIGVYFSIFKRKRIFRKINRS